MLLACFDTHTQIHEHILAHTPDYCNNRVTLLTTNKMYETIYIFNFCDEGLSKGFALTRVLIYSFWNNILTYKRV